MSFSVGTLISSRMNFAREKRGQGEKVENMWNALRSDSSSKVPSKNEKGRRNSGWVIASGLTAIIAGFLILNSGFHTQSVMLSALLNPAFKQGQSALPEMAQLVLRIGSLILGAIVSLSGILVLLGAGLVFLRHLTIGKILIALGGGVGFFGIGVALIYAIATSGGFSVLFSHVEYWIGLCIATFARAMVGKAQRK
jgi:hypothetical protein